MFKEFKEFAMRGNVLDMAIGIIVGGAFTPIAKSLVDDVLMPPIGLLLGGVEFENFFFVLKQGDPGAPYATVAAAQESGAVTINYGMFVNNLIVFVIVAFAIFLLVKGINRVRREEEGADPEEPAVKKCPHCLSDIPSMAERCAFCTAELAT